MSGNTNVVPLKSDGRGLVLTDLNEMWQFATIAVKGGFAPKSLNTVEKCFCALQLGAEVGLLPMQSLASVMVINGRPSLWGDGLKAIVERSTECEYITETITGSDETLTATCTAKRRGRPEPCVRSFSYADAKAANLLSKDGDLYRKYPGRMLQMRARSWALRDQFADLLCGMVAAEEAMDYGGSMQSGGEAPTEQLDTLTVELSEPKQLPSPLDEAIEAMGNPTTDDEPPANWKSATDEAKAEQQIAIPF